MRKVIEGVYETGKMQVRIDPSSVSKIFKKKRDYKKRYSLEKKALQRLQGLNSFPNLLSFDDNTFTLKMSRLKGTEPQKLSVQQIDKLREMISTLLDKGVARRSIPLRDLLAENNATLAMVDFERVTLRNFAWSPIWLLAKINSRYHLNCIIKTQQPQLLTLEEQNSIAKINKIRVYLNKLKQVRKKIKKLI